jgi:hypothetical protein
MLLFMRLPFGSIDSNVQTWRQNAPIGQRDVRRDQSIARILAAGLNAALFTF